MEKTKRFYLLGVGGVGMGALAGLLKAAGHEVIGVEGGPVYPPMSELLKRLGIEVLTGYQRENPLRVAPDLAIVGNVIRRDNPELETIFSQGLPYLSFPEALYGFFIKGYKSLVVAGTHGKTTTSALLAYSLERLGQDPTFLIGGLLRDRGQNFRLGRGDFVVLEGDEYDSAFFDKRPKFIHYAPSAAILTSIEFDHADIYQDFETLKAAFYDLISVLSPQGLLVYWADSQVVKEVASAFSGRKIAYGREGECKLLSRHPSQDPFGQYVEAAFLGEKFEFFLPLLGAHNALNALAVFSLLAGLGFSREEIVGTFSSFPGTRRRQEILLTEPVVIIDDFAHHPTAVRVTLEAIKEVWPQRRLLAVFEPRTNTSRRKVFQKEYPSALALAEVVFVNSPPDLAKIAASERLDLGLLVSDLRKTVKKAYLCRSIHELKEKIVAEIRPGDVLTFLSNGPFDNLPHLLAEELGRRT